MLAANVWVLWLFRSMCEQLRLCMQCNPNISVKVHRTCWVWAGWFRTLQLDVPRSTHHPLHLRGCVSDSIIQPRMQHIIFFYEQMCVQAMCQREKHCWLALHQSSYISSSTLSRCALTDAHAHSLLSLPVSHTPCPCTARTGVQNRALANRRLQRRRHLQ